MGFLHYLRAASLLLVLSSPVRAEEDPVIMSVGDQKLTLSTIQKELKTSPSAGRQPHWESLPEDVRLTILQGISRQFVLQQAAEKNIKEDDPRIAERLAKMRDQIRLQLYTEDTVADLVSDRDVQKAAKTALKEERQYRYQLMQLLAQDADTIRKGATLLKEDKALGTIETEVPGITASDLGWVEEDALFTPLDTIVKPLKSGEVSEPVHTPFGWHVLLLLKKEMAPEGDIEGLLPNVREVLNREAWNEHIHELYGKAKVTYRDANGKFKALPW